MFILATLFISWTTLAAGGSTDKFTFQNCRQSNSERFALSGCPSGRYIAIQLAEIGFNARWRGDYPQHRCKERDVICKKSTGHSGILACNGRRTCSFGHGVLTFPQGGVQKLCSRHRDANFISVRYQCINAMKTTMTTTSVSSTATYDNYTDTESTAQETSLLGTLSQGEFTGLIVGALLLLLTLLTFSIVITVCFCRSGCNWRKSTKEASTSTDHTDQVQHYHSIDETQRASDAATSANHYQPLNLQQLNNPRNPSAPYLEIIPNG